MGRLRTVAVGITAVGLVAVGLGACRCPGGAAGREAPPPIPRPVIPRPQITYPLAGALFPADIAPPIIRWRDRSGAKQWLVRVTVAGASSVAARVDRPFWKPSPPVWRAIKQHSTNRPARLVVSAVHGRGPVSSAPSTFSTSPDRVDAPIFFRDVPLPFRHAVAHLATIRWRLGEVSSGRPARVVMSRVGRCANCHSFSLDGSTFGMNVDWLAYDGSFTINRVGPRMVIDRASTVAFSRAAARGSRTAAFLNAISPDGRYVVTSVNDASVVIPGGPGDLMFSFSAFFTYRGTLVVHDRKERTFAPLPGANDPAFAHTNPTWSPDGKHLVFARGRALSIPEAEASGRPLFRQREVIERVLRRVKGYRYDLYRVPFNGGRGGVAAPLAGASKNGKSNYFPRYTPDGRWIVFTRAANFNLLQPDSRLFIIPAAGGRARKLACNTARFNSWHSFSPNGKWMVFASKARGPYTELWLTHVDREGRTTPAVLLESLSLSAEKRAANIPEFVNIKPDAELKLEMRYR